MKTTIDYSGLNDNSSTMGLCQRLQQIKDTITMEDTQLFFLDELAEICIATQRRIRTRQLKFKLRITEDRNAIYSPPLFRKESNNVLHLSSKDRTPQTSFYHREP